MVLQMLDMYLVNSNQKKKLAKSQRKATIEGVVQSESDLGVGAPEESETTRRLREQGKGVFSDGKGMSHMAGAGSTPQDIMEDRRQEQIRFPPPGQKPELQGFSNDLSEQFKQQQLRASKRPRTTPASHRKRKGIQSC